MALPSDREPLSLPEGGVQMAVANITATVHPAPSTLHSSSSPLPSPTNRGIIAQLPLPTSSYPNDPQNLNHDRAAAGLSVPAADQHTREEESKVQAAEAHFQEVQKAEAATALDVSAAQSSEEAANIAAALNPSNHAYGKAVFEASWDAEQLARLVAAADNEHLLTLLSKLDERPINSRLSFHDVTFTRNGVEYLSHVSGSVEPGRLTALIGAPDSGITLLLSLLAGRPPLFGRMTGDILFDGQPISSTTRKSVGYVVKEDPNLPQFTVFETLNFSAQLRVSDESPKLLRFRTLLWMKLLGLSHTYNTVVGDALTRGVSGGERRRVSYGCEMIAGQSLVLADLPTNGLDSTSAFGLIKNVTGLCRTGRGMLVSVVQPSPEILALFDDIMLMSKGAVLYSGPPALVEAYLNQRGFERPDSKTLPDWVEEMSATPEHFWVSNIPAQLQGQVHQTRQRFNMLSPKAKLDSEQAKPQQQHPAQVGSGSTPIDPSSTTSPAVVEKPELVRAKSSMQQMWTSVRDSFSTPAGYVNPDGTLRGQAWLYLTRTWRESEEAAAVEKQLAALPRVPADSALRQAWNRYPRSFGYQVGVLFHRQGTLTFRNRGIWLGNIMQSIVMGLIIGTLFYKISLSQNAIRVRFGLAFFSVLNMGMGTAQMIPVHFSQRRTFYNQRQNGYYSSAAYYLAAYLTQLPVGLAETFLFSIIMYPLAGLQDGISSHWLYWWLVLVLVNWVSRAWIMFLVSISPTEAVTQVLQPISMLLFSTMSGFLAPKSSIPSGWSWLYTISYFTYALRGLAISEQYGLQYECDAASCPYQTGYEVLGLYDMQDSLDSRWTDVQNLVWFFIAFSAGTAFMYLTWQWSHTPVGELPNYLDDEKAISKERSVRAIERAASHARSQHKVDHKAYIEWRDLCYTVPIKSKETGQTEQRLLLDHTYGWAQPNAMIALMGASGAGKSTLMDVLALKKNFAGQQISGRVLVNGVEQEPVSFSRIAGYVEQADSHNPFSTVREAVEVSARLRLPTNTTDVEMQRHVDRVLSSLGITHLQHEIIGEAGDAAGVAPEVRKKVTIAVELIMNPSLLFLDEPTTGLDAPGALSVMKAVRELAREIAVVCTIHQPSAEIVGMFDGLLLMKSGGQVAYFGALTELPEYFRQQRLGEYTEGHNMGDFALSCIKRAEQSKVDMDGKPVDVAQAFLQSPNGQSVMARLEQGIVPEVERNRTHTMPESEYPGMARQMAVLTQRFFVRRVPRRQHVLRAVDHVAVLRLHGGHAVRAARAEPAGRQQPHRRRVHVHHVLRLLLPRHCARALRHAARVLPRVRLAHVQRAGVLDRSHAGRRAHRGGRDHPLLSAGLLRRRPHPGQQRHALRPVPGPPHRRAPPRAEVERGGDRGLRRPCGGHCAVRGERDHRHAVLGLPHPEGRDPVWLDLDVLHLVHPLPAGLRRGQRAQGHPRVHLRRQPALHAHRQRVRHPRAVQRPGLPHPVRAAAARPVRHQVRQHRPGHRLRRRHHLRGRIHPLQLPRHAQHQPRQAVSGAVRDVVEARCVGMYSVVNGVIDTSRRIG